jgi:hypothetical protein
VADFLARAPACSLPIIPAWDFTLKGWMGDGDWRNSQSSLVDVPRQ